MSLVSIEVKPHGDVKAHEVIRIFQVYHNLPKAIS